jgi:hypothetical protein
MMSEKRKREGDLGKRMWIPVLHHASLSAKRIWGKRRDYFLVRREKYGHIMFETFALHFPRDPLVTCGCAKANRNFLI